MRKGLILVLLLAPFLVTAAEAQEDWFFGLAWSVSVPFEDTKEFTDKTSFRGAAMEIRKMNSPNLSFGGVFAWNVFDWNGEKTGSVDNTTVTGFQYRYLNAFPLMLNGHYYFGKRDGTRFFAGLNAGGFITEYRLEVGLIALTEDKWQWGGAPEVGLAVPFNWNLAGFVNARYYYGFKTGNIPALNYLNFGVGLVWR
jgi:outer membrane protein